MRRTLVFGFSALALFVVGSGWLPLYPPVPADLDGARDLDPEARHVRIPVATLDSLDGWLLPGRGLGAGLPPHGYGRAHDRVWRYADFLRPAGYTLLTCDFRSSRTIDRLPTTLGFYELQDAQAALEWLRGQPALAGRPIAVLGESLGGSVALMLAARNPDVAAVVADCPFASGRRALEDAYRRIAHLPAWPAVPLTRWVATRLTGHDPGLVDVMPAARRLADRPLYFIHSGEDDRMDPAQARDLWRAAGAKDSIWFIADAGHNEGWQRHRREYESRVLGFLDRRVGGASTIVAATERPIVTGPEPRERPKPAAGGR